MDRQTCQNYIWNMLGSLANASVSILLTMILSHSLGAEAAGLFSLGFANAMMLQHIGSFDSRSVQCADVKNVFSFGDLLSFRLITNTLMMLAAGGLIWASGYTADKAWATLFLCFYCVWANFSDLFQGLAQKESRLDISGKSMFLRSVLLIAVFFAAALITRNVYVCFFTMSLSQLAVILFYDLRETARFSRVFLCFQPEKLKLAFRMTAPLCVCMFLQMLIYNMPKYAIDAYADLESQAIYGILFLPASVMTLFANILFRPVLTDAARLWADRRFKELKKLLFRQIFIVLCALVLAVLGGYLVGIPVLSLLYGMDFSSHRMVLVIILCGSGFAGISSLLYFISSAIHKQMRMMLGYILTAFAAAFSAFPLVKKFFLTGAACSYFIASVFLCLVLLCIILSTIHAEQKKTAPPSAQSPAAPEPHDSDAR